jgi:hypothetical protein
MAPGAGCLAQRVPAARRAPGATADWAAFGAAGRAALTLPKRPSATIVGQRVPQQRVTMRIRGTTATSSDRSRPRQQGTPIAGVSGNAPGTGASPMAAAAPLAAAPAMSAAAGGSPKGSSFSFGNALVSEADMYQSQRHLVQKPQLQRCDTCPCASQLEYVYCCTTPLLARFS